MNKLKKNRLVLRLNNVGMLKKIKKRKIKCLEKQMKFGILRFVILHKLYLENILKRYFLNISRYGLVISKKLNLIFLKIYINKYNVKLFLLNNVGRLLHVKTGGMFFKRKRVRKSHHALNEIGKGFGAFLKNKGYSRVMILCNKGSLFQIKKIVFNLYDFTYISGWVIKPDYKVGLVRRKDYRRKKTTRKMR